MEQLISLDWVTILSIILSLASFILAILSIVFSTLFFHWSKIESNNLGHLTTTITEKVNCLEKLFDKMYSSTYEMVRENNRAMQKQLFSDPLGSQCIENKDMEVYLSIGCSNTIDGIIERTGYERNEVEQIVMRMGQKGYVTMEDGKIYLPKNRSESSDES